MPTPIWKPEFSNFHPATVELDGSRYPTTEHAYQAGKTLDINERRKIQQAKTPGIAKKLGGPKAKGGIVTLRPDWETVKEPLMLDLTRQKYTDPELRALLLATGTQTIVELNRHHDNEWGDCQCAKCANTPGKNKLGKTLMQHRKELQTPAPTPQSPTPTPTDTIAKFNGDHAFLAAWYPATVTLRGTQYKSIETAIAQATISDDALLDLLGQKYQNSALATQLTDTGNAKLINGNHNHDNDLGVCYCSQCQGSKGANRLGKLTMQIRQQLAAKPQQLTTVWVAGGRDFDNWQLLVLKLGALTANLHPIKIVEGGATGADQMAGRWADQMGYKHKTIEAEWELYATAGQKNPAGMIRNRELCAMADVAIFFWDGRSPGTENSIELAKQKGIPHRVIRY